MGNWAAKLAAITVLAACSSTPADTDPTGSGAGGPAGGGGARSTPFTEEAMRAASIAYFTKLCTMSKQCEPVQFSIWSGTLEQCIDAHATAADLANLFSYGTKLTPDSLLACAEALDVALSTCTKYERYWYEFDVPDACQAVNFGTAEDGEACSPYNVPYAPLSNDCKSGRCAPSAPGTCSHCIAKVALGEECTTPGNYGECPPGAICWGAAKPYSCVGLVAEGGHCDEAPCHFDLLCDHGTCVVPPADGSCDPDVGCGWFPAYLTCNPTTLKCEGSVSGPNEACGPPLENNGAFYTPCVFGQSCTTVHSEVGGGGGAPMQFVCEPQLAEGEPCNPQDHLLSDGCRHTTLHSTACINGVCAPFDGSTCTAPALPP